ncbi:hypothetical protein ZWY2020_028147 [Hordeum vulgare]|nr:hypothetical protein ZWY2020_028147 [Hordeum vulgare]
MDGDYVSSLLAGTAGLDFGVPGLNVGSFDTLCGTGLGARQPPCSGTGDRMHGSKRQFGPAEGGELSAASRRLLHLRPGMGEATGPDSKKCKIEDETVRPKVEEEAATAIDGLADGERGRKQAKGMLCVIRN